MAVKTITIDMQAYDILSSEKTGDDSFSKVIKRRLGAEKTAASLLRSLPGILVSEETLEHTEAVVRDRGTSSVDPPVLDFGE